MRIVLARKGQVIAEPAMLPEDYKPSVAVAGIFPTAAFGVASLLVNGIAVAGQYGWATDHIGWGPVFNGFYAAAIESVAVTVAAYAHEAQKANDSALRLKLASYGIGAGVGSLNYWHYAPAFTHPDAKAMSLGFLSALSPWLWGLWSRRKSRDILLHRGLIEERSVKLGSARWTWHLWRSAHVMFRATWTGEKDPARAIADWETGTDDAAVPVPDNGADTGTEPGATADTASGSSASAVMSTGTANVQPEVPVPDVPALAQSDRSAAGTAEDGTPGTGTGAGKGRAAVPAETGPAAPGPRPARWPNSWQKHGRSWPATRRITGSR